MSKEHVETSEGGMPFCAHCGGAVGEDGYAEEMRDSAGDTPELSPELTVGEGEKMKRGLIAPEPEQGARAADFLSALRRRQRSA